MEGGHLVALGDVVGVAGDEHNLDRVVVLPQVLCHGHAVHIAHFDVQQQDVIVLLLGVAEQKAFGGGEGGERYAVSPFPGPLLYERGDILPVRAGVVADRDFVIHSFFHRPFPFPL